MLEVKKNNCIEESELILNPDGSIYHLNLQPEQLADTVITVGDPDRVDAVSKYFDTIECKVHKREFNTHTGKLNGKRISVISTGIGTDNIDIVFNELDALKNIDFKTREIKSDLKKLDIVRIGTSGAIQPDIPVDSFLISSKAIGFDSLIHFYENTYFLDETFSKAIISHCGWNENKAVPYIVSANEDLLNLFSKKDMLQGITLTNVGFYGPQGRVLRLPVQDTSLNDNLSTFSFQNEKITNMEMETSGIYSMARLLGHRAISLNAILANRANGTFSKNPEKNIDSLIRTSLEILTQ